jgi:hypothetical protein
MAEPFETAPSGGEKVAASHHEDLKSNAHQAAERGHAATDMYVHAGGEVGSIADIA